ncbi:hypothetical protein [Cerasicoccus maritimus]|uniref:hypothetical protein n=1 Tax=Cerasicoccus maritimus TaxID=490089 RepID=UPI002852AEF9|nr:hypothetical protein [Cerasicoccus maritimus]
MKVRHLIPLSSLMVSICSADFTTFDTPTADDPWAGLRISVNNSSGAKTLQWWGKQDYVYFLLASDDLQNYYYINQYFVGQDAVINTFNFNITGIDPSLFYVLRYTDGPVNTTDVGALDLDGDGYSVDEELSLGLDPLVNVDANDDGVPDDHEAVWNAIPLAWFDQIINDPYEDYYDPNGLIAIVSDVNPGDDYDGDGVSNLQEFLGSTGPADFFNGDTPVIEILSGNNQIMGSDMFTPIALAVSVKNSEGATLSGVPIKFEVGVGGLGQISKFPMPSGLSSDPIYSISEATGAYAFYYSPELVFGTEDETVVATLPNFTGLNVVFTIHVDVDYVPVPPDNGFEDLDGDLLDDSWEIAYFGSLLQGATDDSDEDGMNNLLEFQTQCNPCNPDTDDDGMEDMFEYYYSLNALSSDGDGSTGPNDDFDGDTISNLNEFSVGNAPNAYSGDPFSFQPECGVHIECVSFDGYYRVSFFAVDGFIYIWEYSKDLVNWTYDTERIIVGENALIDNQPINADPIVGFTNFFRAQILEGLGDEDGDMISNADEVNAGTDPFDSSSNDGDLIPDDWEVFYGLDTTSGVDSSAYDSDGDLLSDMAEFQRGSNPTVKDTDGDGSQDFQDASPRDEMVGALTLTITFPTQGDNY